MFVIAAATAWLAATTVAAPVRDPAAAFGSMPMFADVEASPDGTMLSALVRSDGRSGLGVFSLKNGFTYKRFIEDDAARKVRYAFWKTNDRLVVSAEMPSRRNNVPTVERRLFGVDPDGKSIIPLYKRDRRSVLMPPQLQDRIVSTLPNDPKHILVQYLDIEVGDVFVFRVRVDRTAPHQVVQRGIPNSRFWMADRDGNIRVVTGVANQKRQLLRFKQPNGKWKDASHRVADGAPRFQILGLANDLDTVYVGSDHASATLALYPYNVVTDQLGEQLFVHPTSDVFDAVISSQTGELVGAAYAEDEPQTFWFQNAVEKRILDAIRKATEAENLGFHSLNSTGNTAVVSISTGVEPSQFLVFSKNTGELLYLPSQYPALDGVPLGKVITTSYKARDGLTIPAFITLPPGVASLKQAKRLPFVLMPHGGPAARDFVGFDYMAQFLAHRGFGVLQMNFRGSSGYGAEFKQAGNRQWGQAMQDDITDGARWLFAKGYADAQRTSIVGASYGGYAAAMGAAKTPDLYRCAVALNGVFDLPRLISDDRDYVDSRYRTRYIGRLWQDRDMLRENSPVRRVDDIKVPMLLVHGEKDRVVPVAQSREMADALRRRGKAVRYVELPEGSHYLDVNDNRVTFLREMDGFLSGCR